jgi:hypothetical protein
MKEEECWAQRREMGVWACGVFEIGEGNGGGVWKCWKRGVWGAGKGGNRIIVLECVTAYLLWSWGVYIHCGDVESLVGCLSCCRNG